MILYIILYFLLLFALLFYFKERESAFSPIYIFFIFNTIYNVFIPIETYYFPISIQGITIPTYVSMEAIQLAILSLIGFTGGYLLFIKKYSLLDIQQNSNTRKDTSLYYLLLSVSLFLLFYFFKELKQSLSYSGNVTASALHPAYNYTKEVFANAYSAFIFYILLRKKPKLYWSILLAIPLLLFGILTSDKDPMIMAIIPYGIYYASFMKNKPTVYHVLTTIFLFIIIPILALTFSEFRGTKKYDNLFKYEKGYYSRIDSYGPFLVLNDAIQQQLQENYNYNYGYSFIQSFAYTIPRSLWPGRPINPAIIYAKKKMKNRYAPGRGFGYSLMAEAINAFGFWGALLFYFLIGTLIGLLQRLTLWIFKYNTKLGAAIFSAWIFYHLLIIHRGFFISTSSYIRYIIPFLIFAVIFDIYKLDAKIYSLVNNRNK